MMESALQGATLGVIVASLAVLVTSMIDRAYTPKLGAVFTLIAIGFVTGGVGALVFKELVLSTAAALFVVVVIFGIGAYRHDTRG